MMKIKKNAMKKILKGEFCREDQLIHSFMRIYFFQIGQNEQKPFF